MRGKSNKPRQPRAISPNVIALKHLERSSFSSICIFSFTRWAILFFKWKNAQRSGGNYDFPGENNPFADFNFAKFKTRGRIFRAVADFARVRESTPGRVYFIIFLKGARRRVLMKINLSPRAFSRPSPKAGKGGHRSAACNGAEFHLPIRASWRFGRSLWWDEHETESNEAIRFAQLTINTCIRSYLVYSWFYRYYHAISDEQLQCDCRYAIISIDIVRGKFPIVKIMKRYEF